MAKDIEKLIENVEVPEMEYTKPKRKSISYEVPEVVLPKTKAEMYEEAKGRLTQKTTAASKAYDGARKPKTRKKPASVKTVDLEFAAAAVAGAESNAQKTAEHKNAEEIKKRIAAMRKIVEEPKWVGNADDLVPFAWRFPLSDVGKPSKFYRNAVRAERNRAMMLPVPGEK